MMRNASALAMLETTLWIKHLRGPRWWCPRPSRYVGPDANLRHVAPGPLIRRPSRKKEFLP